jgi:hypothetical protein
MQPGTAQPMKFVMHRKRTVVSTCGLSVEFEKGVPTLVPPAMFAEVIAVGAVPENEIPEDELPAGKPSPAQLIEREQQMFAAFDAIVKRASREDFTAGGVPHNTVLSRELGWSVQAKERDAAWVKYTSGAAARGD